MSYICAHMNKAIHYGTAVYFALIVLIRMMAMPISLIEYSLNKKFIAENLCENRFKSEVHCGGTCYLNKQLKKASDNQNTDNRQGSYKILVIDFFEQFRQPQFGCSESPRVCAIAVNAPCRTENYCGLLFRPPIA